MSRYCNKDIKVISIKTILLALCQLWHIQYWLLHSEKTSEINKISEICKEKYCGGVPLQSNHFVAVDSNFIYDSEAYDLMKLYFQTSHSESVQTIVVELFCGNSQTY